MNATTLYTVIEEAISKGSSCEQETLKVLCFIAEKLERIEQFGKFSKEDYCVVCGNRLRR